MTPTRLILRSLAFHRRTHAGVAAGAAIATAVLVGALLVGASLRGTLLNFAAMRLGKVTVALDGGDRYFRAAVAENHAAAVLYTRAVASNANADRRANSVIALGVDNSFWALAPDDRAIAAKPGAREMVLSAVLAEQLRARVGDEVVLRVEKPSALPRDVPVAGTEDAFVALRVRVVGIASDEAFGRFGLRATQKPPYNAFLDRAWLAEQIGQHGRANLLVSTGEYRLTAAIAGDTPVTIANRDLAHDLTLDDLQLRLAELPDHRLELRSDRVFLESAVRIGATKGLHDAKFIGDYSDGVLTYFVNEIRCGDSVTPYSFVSGIGSQFHGDRISAHPASMPAGSSPAPNGSAKASTPALPRDQGIWILYGLNHNEIILNDWLAEDLGAKKGDRVTLKYFEIDPRGGLVEKESSFTVRDIVPIAGWADDPRLAPDIPGLSDTENCREWDPSMPIDLKKIRDKDEAYWKAHKGTPKAFVSLEAAQRMWGNRYGSLTAIRFPDVKPEASDALAREIVKHINPASLGLAWQDVATPARAASTQGQDFGSLFLGLSFFLIAAAVLLTAMLFSLGIEQRAGEIGTLLALGFTPRKVRRLLFVEGLVLAIVGSLLGVPLGVLFTQAILWALGTLWQGAVGGTMKITLHIEPMPIAIGAISGVIVAGLAMAWTLRKQARRTPRDLLAHGSDAPETNTSGTRATAIHRGGMRRVVTATLGVAMILITIALVLWMRKAGMTTHHGKGASMSAEAQAGVFFGAGAAMLVGGLCLAHSALWFLRSRADTNAAHGLSLRGLAMRNAARRPGRSLAVIAMLACGVFLVVAVGVNRKPDGTDLRRESGSMGFALYAQSATPIPGRLLDAKGLESLGADASKLKGVNIVPMRLREGDDASCLNLNRAQTPSVLGVDPARLRGRGRPRTPWGGDDGMDVWKMLDEPPGRESEGADHNAFADEATLMWGLGKSLGGRAPTHDERGAEVVLALSGSISQSPLQGYLILGDKSFVDMYPNITGYRVFLIETDRLDKVSRELTRAFADYGLEVTPTAQWLARFNAVENTYLSIFLALGALGMLLSTAGLAALVLRGVMERRGELAMMRAVGFTRSRLRRVLVMEHAGLLVAGLVVGVVSAVIASWPSVAARGGAGFEWRSLASSPWVSAGVAVLAITLAGAAWTWVACAWAVRGELLAALRNE